MALKILQSDGARGLRPPVVTWSRSNARVVGIVVVLLTVPLVVVLLVEGHLPVTGLVVSFVLLLAAVWLLMPPTADGG